MKKSTKKILLSGLALSMLLFLSGCVRTVNGKPAGFVWDTLGKPMEKVIQYFANDLGLGFGLGIIAVTIIVRIIILPLGLYQAQKAAYQSEKMAYLKPYLGPIQERMKTAATQEEKLAAQADFMAAQRQYGVSMFGGIGCLPLLIQMPFFSALYFAARYTNGIQGSQFLWFALDKPDLLLTAIIAALYFFQSWLSMKAVPEEQRAQMKSMMYSMPLMMAFFGFSSPAGVSLYWFIGGFFAIAQQLITTYVIKPRLRQKVEAEFAQNPPKPFKSSGNSRKDVTPSNSPIEDAIESKKPKRNAGKQNRK
ncbi:membrane protein insertase YidC [Streptococcus hyovaginalis]|uniref:membrane protein insertase YidC n=1 Tax=Streptococcus hyovaginalis TaxID=149015 RepID=UPI002A82EF8F|nr:membrane protein insertase YidC [Streptococcus hyovaginalis]MDY4510309.1 membrane protein insertase YidC [Streptococcus hyovaginalis]